MYLTRLIYTSTITDTFTSEDMSKILSKARAYNEKVNVTGMLCFNRNYFLQCIEGSRTEVNKLYQKVIDDKRHTNVVLLDYKEIHVREFSQWSMGYLPESKVTRPINLKHSSDGNFNPYEMSGESAHSMMLTLKNSVASI